MRRRRWRRGRRLRKIESVEAGYGMAGRGRVGWIEISLDVVCY